MITADTLALGQILCLLGVLGMVFGVFFVWFPKRTQAVLLAFPRSRWPGWVLMAINVFWAAWVLHHASLGRFSGVKPLIPYLAILVFGAVVWLLDELLSPRALGGLLLLVANPILMAVRWADSAWRFVPAVVAYIWVVAGCAFMLHPWLFRRMVEALVVSPRRFRAAGWGKLIAGLVLLAAGLSHLR